MRDPTYRGPKVHPTESAAEEKTFPQLTYTIEKIETIDLKKPDFDEKANYVIKVNDGSQVDFPAWKYSTRYVFRTRTSTLLKGLTYLKISDWSFVFKLTYASPDDMYILVSPTFFRKNQKHFEMFKLSCDSKLKFIKHMHELEAEQKVYLLWWGSENGRIQTQEVEAEFVEIRKNEENKVTAATFRNIETEKTVLVHRSDFESGSFAILAAK